MSQAERIIHDARVAAMTHAHEAHAARQRAMLCRAPVSARHLLLQSTAQAFHGTEEGRVLASLEAWITMGVRHGHHTAADAAALQGIKADLLEAAQTIAEAMDALGDQIDGE